MQRKFDLCYLQYLYILFILFENRNLKELVETKRAFAIPLRTLEVFTSPSWYAQINDCNGEEHATAVSMYLARNGGYFLVQYSLLLTCGICNESKFLPRVKL